MFQATVSKKTRTECDYLRNNNYHTEYFHTALDIGTQISDGMLKVVILNCMNTLM